jgi:DivIVA domain-containing protein
MDDLAATIRAARFTPTRLRKGYDQGDVDKFLDELVAAVQAERPLRPLVDAARFSTTKVTEGYDMSEVDDFLDRVTGAPQAAPQESPAYEQYVAPAAGEPLPTAVQEQKGLLSRLLGRR